MAPEPGQIAFVRQRRYLVEEVTTPSAVDEATLVDLSCLDDDAQGEPLSVLWEHELDARVLTDDGWAAVAEKGFDGKVTAAAARDDYGVAVDPVQGTIDQTATDRLRAVRD